MSADSAEVSADTTGPHFFADFVKTFTFGSMLPEAVIFERSRAERARSATNPPRADPLAHRMRTRPAMHAILFSVKRTFHKSVWFGRYLLKDYGLTPSRFDILYILQSARDLPSMWQSRIREILGIARTTLSRMIKALLRLGFIERTRSTLDRRQFEISLTRYGRKTIAHATRTIIQSGIIAHVIIHFVCTKWNCARTTLHEIDQLDSTLLRMREQLHDKATLAYPWHPDR